MTTQYKTPVEVLDAAQVSMSLIDMVDEKAEAHSQPHPSRPEEVLAIIEDLLKSHISAYQWRLDPDTTYEIDSGTVHELMFWASALRDLNIKPAILPWLARRPYLEIRQKCPNFVLRSEREWEQNAIEGFIEFCRFYNYHIQKTNSGYKNLANIPSLVKAAIEDAYGAPDEETRQRYQETIQQFVGYLLVNGLAFYESDMYDPYGSDEAKRKLVYGSLGIDVAQFDIEQQAIFKAANQAWGHVKIVKKEQ